MSFLWLDFLVGFLVLGSFVHLVMAYNNKPFPSVFGNSAMANAIYSEVVVVLAVGAYVFLNDFQTLMNNGVLLGMMDMYVCYLVFGRWITRRFSSERKSEVGRSVVTG